MNKIKFAVIGTGRRGTSLAKNVLAAMEDVDLVAVSDGYEDKANQCALEVEKVCGKRPLVYLDYRKMFSEVELDAVLVATGWEEHVNVSIEAMKRGIPVALEVGGAYSIEDCYRLVDTYEQTKTPFMLMENCCYDKDELLVTSLVRHGVFGEVVYCHGAYAHDLREEVSYGNRDRHYRLRNYINRNCESYPTHELGPIAKLLGINRGNRMVSLVSMSSKSRGLEAYVHQHDDLQELEGVSFKQGDIFETLIKCENGEMISLRLDTTLPRYYSREFTIRGTKAMFVQDAYMVLEDGKFDEIYFPYQTYQKYAGNAQSYEDEYLPDIWKKVTPEILQAGHGGMDWFIFRAFIEALQKGEEMPIDVYDAAAWMAITCLSEQSVAQGSKEIAIPDFTRGKYKNRPLKDVIDL